MRFAFAALAVMFILSGCATSPAIAADEPAARECGDGPHDVPVKFLQLCPQGPIECTHVDTPEAFLRSCIELPRACWGSGVETWTDWPTCPGARRTE